VEVTYITVVHAFVRSVLWGIATLLAVYDVAAWIVRLAT
jgi:hypothetical protein